MSEILVLNSINSPSKPVYFQLERTVNMPFNGNKILFATTSDRQKVVIKLVPDSDKARKEWMGLSVAYMSSIPVPTPLMFGVTKNNTPGIVSKRIDGRLLYGNKNPDTRIEFGNIVQRLHSNVQVEQSDKDYSFYERSLNDWTKRGYFSPSLFDKFAWSMSQYCQIAPSVLCHGDLHDGQVIKSPPGLVLIDFEKWQSNRPLYELGIYLFHCLRTGSDIQNFRNFVMGYTDRTYLDETEKQTLMYYLLHISTGALNYFLEVNNWYLEYARQNQRKVLKFINDEVVWKIL